jgi:hypothetical protein
MGCRLGSRAWVDNIQQGQGPVACCALSQLAVVRLGALAPVRRYMASRPYLRSCCVMQLARMCSRVNDFFVWAASARMAAVAHGTCSNVGAGSRCFACRVIPL